MYAITPSRALALFVSLVLAAGCGSSSSSSSRGGVAAAAPTAAAPNPGGVTAAAVVSSVQAQLTTNAFAAFKENVSISDLVIPSDPAIRDRAFVAEDDGTLRVLDLSGPAPALDRAVSLFTNPMPAGTATGALRIQSASVGLLTTSGTTAEGVALFDPVAAQGPADVTWFDLGGVTATWPAGTLNSAGVDVGGSALPLTYTADAAVSTGKLFVVSNNLDAAFKNNPGTILVYGIDLTTRTISGGALVQTTNFNPTGITRVTTPQGEALLVTNTGAFGQNDCSIDVIDPVSLTKVASIPFPTANPTSPVGRVIVSPDGRRGYIGSQSAAEVYVLDLEGIGLELANQATTSASARFLGGWSLPSSAAFNFISSVAISHTGNYLYAVNFNESALYVIDLQAQEVGAAVTGFQRSGSPAGYEGLANKIAVRPGVPGLDYQGPSIFGMTINLAVTDQTITNVKVALDAVTVDKH